MNCGAGPGEPHHGAFPEHDKDKKKRKKNGPQEASGPGCSPAGGVSPALAADYFASGRALESIFGALYSGAIPAGAVLSPDPRSRSPLTMPELRENSPLSTAALTPAQPRAIHGSASRIASSKRHGGLITASRKPRACPPRPPLGRGSGATARKAPASSTKDAAVLIPGRIPQRIAAGGETAHRLTQGAQHVLEPRRSPRADRSGPGRAARPVASAPSALQAVGLAHLDGDRRRTRASGTGLGGAICRRRSGSPPQRRTHQARRAG